MVSIIVPVHNSESYITPCVNSILSQNGVLYELLLVDDGSTDASLSICKTYEKKFDNVRVLSKNNGGVSSARNMGIEVASGDLVYFVDADDVLMPNALYRMANAMEEDSSIDLFIGGYIVKNKEEQVIYSVSGTDGYIISREQGIEQMFHPHPYRYQGYIWNKMFRRSVIERNHLRFDEAISYNEDRLFVTRYIATQRGDILLDNVPVYSYFERDGSAMGALVDCFNPKFISDFDAMRKILKVVRRTFHNKSLNLMAQEEVIKSYARIHSMMDHCGGAWGRVHKSMKLKLAISLSPSFLIQFLKDRSCSISS